MDKYIFDPNALPQPILPQHPEWVELYYKTWKLAFQNVEYIEQDGWKPQMTCMPGVNTIWQWDSCFMVFITNYANGTISALNNLDNLYRLRRESDGYMSMAYRINTELPAWPGRINPPLMALCCSIFGTYALNLVFPRLGEVWRCTYIAQREKASFTTVFGSMLADRMTDTLTVITLTIFTFIVASGALITFLTKYPVGQGILELAQNPLFWAAIIGAIVIVVVAFKVFKSTKIVKKITEMAREFWQGFMVVTKMEGRWKFLGLTFCIWGCFFFQLYVAFYAFSYTAELCFTDGYVFGLVPCLVAFVLSSIGMAVPSNGGLGPWNIAVMFGLAIYGITDAQGTAFSMLVWSAQTVMLIILGIYTMMYISIGKKSKR